MIEGWWHRAGYPFRGGWKVRRVEHLPYCWPMPARVSEGVNENQLTLWRKDPVTGPTAEAPSSSRSLRDDGLK